MTASITAQHSDELDEQQVLAYLRDNPAFLRQHPGVLADLELPHDSGDAVSLVERQLTVLRERNTDMRERLGKLVDTARENDRLFEKTRRLVLDLLMADSLPSVANALDKSLNRDFKTDFSSFCLIGQQEKQADNYRCVTAITARQSVGNLLDAQQVICGVLRQQEIEFLFPNAAGEVQSAAVLPIGQASRIGVLAVGSRDPQHYKSGMGTLFLSYIGEILAHALPRYL